MSKPIPLPPGLAYKYVEFAGLDNLCAGCCFLPAGNHCPTTHGLGLVPYLPSQLCVAERRRTDLAGRLYGDVVIVSTATAFPRGHSLLANVRRPT